MTAYKQVGLTALRSPSGEFLPAVPLYAEVEVGEDGVTHAERRSAGELTEWAVKKIKQYKKGVALASKKAGE